jgi:predicted nucleotidyltransferase
VPTNGVVPLSELGIADRIPLSQAQIEAFCRKWKIREFALFGSVLRDDFRPESDIDVLVEFEDDADHSLLGHARMEREAAGVFNVAVHLVEKVAGSRQGIRTGALAQVPVFHER